MSDPLEPVQQDSPTSLTLLQRAQANDPKAWEQVVRVYTPLVYRWCERGGVRGADADDLVQEVFQAAWCSRENFRRDRPGDTFRGWLRGVTRNAVLMHFRRGARHPQAPGGSEANIQLHLVADQQAGVQEEDEPIEVRGLFRRAVELVRGEFEDRSWQMFWLAVIEERTADEVAARFGVTAAAVRKAKSRILHRLKEEIGDLLE
jgi:RNA polymerase sigma-70 factor (ECF subfamily)